MAKTFKEKRKKVNAIQWTGENIDEFKDFMGEGNGTVTKTGRSLMISTKQQVFLLNEKDHLVLDNGTHSAMNDKDFTDKYKEQPDEE